MKQTVIVISLMLVCFSISSCKKDKSNVNTLIAEKESIKPETKVDGIIPINLETSIVNWQGSMLFSFGEHYGTVNFKEGFIELKNGKISNGNFTVDMTSIINTDGDYSPDLVDHLKNEDFFDVEKYSESKIEFTNFEYVDTNRLKIDANLTIKGITQPVVLYNVDFVSSEGKLYTKFKIDRTDFQINYNTKSIAKVKDYAISDAIELEVTVYLNN